MEIRYTNSLTDLILGSVRSQIRSPLILSFFAISSVIGIIRMHTNMGISMLLFPFFVLPVLIGQSILWLIVIIMVSVINAFIVYYGPKREGCVGEHIFTFLDDRIIEQTKLNRTEYGWDGIYKIAYNKYHIYIYLNTSHYYVVPKRIFTQTNDASEFINYLKAQMENVKARKPETSRSV